MVFVAVVFIIPALHILTSPHVHMLNAIILLVSVLIGGVLPLLIGYIFGDTSTRTKGQAFHHYNGVMFGILAFWVSGVGPQLISSTSIQNWMAQLPIAVGMLVGFFTPTLITAIVVAILAFYYHRGKGGQVEVASYLPFQITLFAVIAIYLIATPIQQLLSGVNGFLEVWIATVILLGVILISYISLWNLRMSAWQKLIHAVTGISFVFATMLVVSQFQSNIYSYIDNVRSMPVATGILATLLVWMLYLYITRLSYRK